VQIVIFELPHRLGGHALSESHVHHLDSMDMRLARTLRTVHIGDDFEFEVWSLGPEIDAEFDLLYPELLKGQLSLPTGFVDAAQRYFDSSNGNPASADRFFNCFSPIWSLYLHIGRVDLAERLWPIGLEPVEQWETTHHRVHKGTAYYFWAMSALIERNIDRGYILAHQALDEDVQSHGHPNPDTPAFALVSLNDDKPDQAFRPWVKEQANYVDGFVADYRSEHKSGLTLGDLKTRFLSNPPHIDMVFSLTHTMARLKEIAGLPHQAKRSLFVAQLQLGLLFDLLLVIDNSIHAKNPAKWQFSDHAMFLLDRSGNPLPRTAFDAIHRQFKTDFNAALTAAVQGNLFAGATVLNRPQCDILLAYELRNRGAHNVEAVPSIASNLDAVHRAVFRVFCAAVEFFY
jgi:hypothetical protein